MTDDQKQAVESLLSDYETSQKCVIGEWSHREDEELEELKVTIADYRKILMA